MTPLAMAQQIAARLGFDCPATCDETALYWLGGTLLAEYAERTATWDEHGDLAHRWWGLAGVE